MQPRGSGFGKRGKVEIAPPQQQQPPEVPSVSPMAADAIKWAGGGLAALVLFGLVMGGTGGGGGLLGGLIGGLLGHKLAKDMAAAKSASPQARAPTAATQPAGHATNSVQRSGFGATGSSGSFFSGG